MVERQAKAFGDAGLHGIHLGAIFLDRLARFGGGEFGRGAVFVGGAEEQNLLPPATLVARIEVRRQLAAHKVTQMFDPVNIGDGGGDEVACHINIPGAWRSLIARAALLPAKDGNSLVPVPRTA